MKLLEGAKLSRRRRPLIALTGLVVAGFLATGIFILSEPRDNDSAPAEDFAAEAKTFLRQNKPNQLSGSLEILLADAGTNLSPTQPHPLLGKSAPAVALTAADGGTVRLGDLLVRGPVVVVFYQGYSCNHCVSQLFDVNEDIAYFREIGGEVIAISADSPALTQERYAKYGAFKFPVLSDPEHAAALRYGVYTPPSEGRREWMAHGTFVIDRQGVIRWANTGDEPFTGNQTLLHHLARLEGLLPKERTAK